MMRLGRPEHPVSNEEQDDEMEQAVITEEAETEDPKAGRSTLLSRLKMLWSHSKEKPDNSNNEEPKD